MIRGLYSTAGALQIADRNHEVIANNLANATMPGFRRQVVAFEPFIEAMSGKGPTSGSAANIGSPGHETLTVFEPGELQFTDRRLDLALQGDGFFVVEGPEGPLYTRNGAFELDGEGTLQTSGGLPVAGVSGPIKIPRDTAQIVVRSDGAVVADNSEVARLRLETFSDTSRLVAAGTTLYKAPADLVADQSQAIVHQGYRESSNVEIVEEMVRMIAGMRLYEASQRSLRAISDAIEMHSNNGLLS